MAKTPSFKGHKLKLGKPKDGKLTGRCSCGGWIGTGTPAEVEEKWSKNHISKFYN